MKNKHTALEWFVVAIILALPFLYLRVSYSSLPSRVATHFNLRGQADGFSDKSSLWAVMGGLSALALFLYLLMKYLPGIDPKRKVALSAGVFRKTGTAVLLLITALNALMVYSAQPGTTKTNKTLYIVLGVFFVYIGNLMNSIKPNYFVGIRIPWTLESEDNWRATHRLGSRVFVISGLVLIAGGLFLPTEAAGILLMVLSALMALAPCCYSFIHFRRSRKNMLPLIVLFALSATISHAQPAAQPQARPQPQPVTGNWIGQLPVSGQQLTLYMHIRTDSNGNYAGDWASLQQHAMGLRLKSITVYGDSCRFETAMMMTDFRGRFESPDSISGVWEQGGVRIPLGLKKSLRPQTLRPPFPYRSDSVGYEGENGVHLGATLTLPIGRQATSRKFPAVILITGSGLQDRDETIFDHKPFALIADYLTRRGIAVLRVDDRGIGRSTGDNSHATSYDYATDVLAGIRYLGSRMEIDTTRIALIGHSEGGLIAPIVYSRWPHLKTLILLAGPGVPGWEIILRQQTDPVKAIGTAAYNSYYDFTRRKLELLNDTRDQPDSITLAKLKTLYADWKAGLPDSIAASLNVKQVSPEFFATQEKVELKPWLRYFYSTDPRSFLSVVHCPVLALDGEKDSQVDPGQNIPAIKAALGKSGAVTETRIFPGLNHLFQHCQTGDFSEYPVIEESFAPEVLDEIGRWTAKFLTL